MKRFNCTVSDKRGEFGDCMEQAQLGEWVRFSDVEKMIGREKAPLGPMLLSGVRVMKDNYLPNGTMVVSADLFDAMKEAAPAAGEGV
jgi:hypothetical protein